MSPGEAKRRLGVAKGIRKLPAVRDALESGDITLGHAQALTEAPKPSPAPAAEATESKAARQHRRRRVSRHGDDFGMIVIRAELTPLAGDEVWRLLCHIARKLWRTQNSDAPADRAPTDVALQTPSTTYRQLLADALVEMARLAASGKGSGIVPHVAPVVLIDLDTLLHGAHGDTVCETTEGTPVAPSELRRLACEAGVLPAVLGTDGQVLDLGFRARFATPAQKQALDIMWGGCFVDGCGVGPDYTHAHHVVPYGPPCGPTDLMNLVPPCSAHHRLIHDGTLTVTQPEPGHVVVTHRDGTVTHCRARHPPPLRAPRHSGPGRGAAAPPACPTDAEGQRAGPEAA